MEHVAIEAVDDEANPLAEHEVRKPLSRALGTDHFAMNYFELSPGESFSGGLHAHNDQEEVFYVASGTARFEVGRDRETVAVGPDEVIRFAPGEFQTGGVPADGDEGVVAIALGARERATTGTRWTRSSTVASARRSTSTKRGPSRTVSSSSRVRAVATSSRSDGCRSTPVESNGHNVDARNETIYSG